MSWGNHSFILMFHRFSASNYSSLGLYNESLFISAANFSQTIGHFKKLGYRFSELNSFNLKKDKQVFVTIDDGYVDINDIALPILENEKVPFTIFCNKNFVQKKQIAWWEGVELLDANQRTFLKRKLLECSNIQKNQDLELRTLVLNLPIDKYHFFLETLNSLLSPDQILILKNLFLTEDQLLRLSENPLCRIGCHSVSHYNMAKLSYAEVAKEMKNDQIYLRSISKDLSEFFCIPYGSQDEYCDLILDTARSLGFSGCLTTEHGSVQRRARNNALPRIYISNNFNRRQLLRLKRKEYLKCILRI